MRRGGREGLDFVSVFAGGWDTGKDGDAHWGVV